ncbi:MAG: AsmA family protein [Porticoccus sp.]|nr:AsmA family protein [Porticoccus sp.]
MKKNNLKKQGGWHWVTRALLWVSSLLLGLLVIFTVLLSVLDDDDYRVALIWGVDRFLDSTLEINGPFTISFGKELELEAKKVHLKANDGTYELSIGDFSGRQKLGSYLKTGTLWINDLTFTDVYVDINIKERGLDQKNGLEAFSIPPIIIEKLDFKNITVVYRRGDLQESETFTLRELIVDDSLNQGPVKVYGAGSLDSRSFVLEGTLGALSQIQDNSQIYPVDLSLVSDTLKASLTGGINDPITGEGLEFQLEINDSYIGSVLQLVDSTIPNFTKFSLTAGIRGDISAPRLEAVAASLYGLDGFEAQVRGAIDNVVLSKGLQLDVSLKAPKIKSLSGLGLLGEDPVDETLLALGPVSFSGKLSGDLDALKLAGAALSLKGLDGVDMTAHGAVDNLISVQGINWDVSLKAPNIKSLSDLGLLAEESLDEDILALGPVDFSAALTGSKEKQLIEDILVNVGPTDSPSIKASGTVQMSLPEMVRVVSKWDVAAEVVIKTIVKELQPGNLGRLKGAISGSVQNDRWHIEKIDIASTDTDMYQLNLEGAFNEKEPDQGSFRGDLSVAQPMALGALFGVDLKGFAPYTASGAVEVDKDRLTYQGKMRIGETEGSMALMTIQVDGQTQVSGKMTIPVMHLSDLGITKVTTDNTGKLASQSKAGQRKTEDTDKAKSEDVDDQPLFSHEVLDFSGLNDLDLDLAVSIDQIIGAGVTVGHLEGQVNVKNSVLRIKPMQIAIEGGVADLELELNANNTPKFSLDMHASNLALGSWISDSQQEIKVAGEVNLDVDLQGEGDSFHEWISSLDGGVHFGLENARIPRKYVEILTVDVFGWALGKAKIKDKDALLDCVMATFDIDKGVAVSQLLIADGPNLSIEGRTTLNFGEESMDMVLLPKQKKRWYSDVSALHIKGPMVNPKVTAVPKKTAATRIGTLVFVPGVAIPVFMVGELRSLFGRGETASTGCESVVATLEGQ